jgi:very-short-patch-repair endonuclease
LEKLETLLKTYADTLFDQDLGTIAQALAPAGHAVSRVLAAITDGRYRKALSTLRALRKAGPASAAQLFTEASLAAEVLRIWRENTTNESKPHLRTPVATLRGPYQEVAGDVDAANPYFAELVPDAPMRDLTTLQQLFSRLSDDDKTPYQVARAAELEREVRTLGGGAYLDEARRAGTDPRRWAEQFEYAWIASCFDKVKLEEPALASFVGATHNQFVGDFTHLDRDRINLAVERVRRAHAERAIQAMNQFPAQEALIRREAEKKRRHMPLRKLLAQAPDVLTAVCPCWMASPLSVSQLLGADRRYFDVVIFDEASQIPPEDAAPAILRASHVVVAGDVQQLPPTRFFATGDDELDESEDEPLASQGFESLLDLMTGFMGNWWLEWHYRSRDEALIAFSNHHIYRDRLITFPGPGGKPGLSHVLVQPNVSELPDRDDMLHSSPAEVRKVVELVLDHARTHPEQSLGVIALGIRHALRIEDELDRALRDHPELDEFFATDKPEPFFVKNLERVQGDERDAIILTVGYSKNRAGRLPYRFGPLLTEGGERRLNVAVTRARDRLTLVSSFSHLDMDPNRSMAKGVQLLRLYLEYAASQGRVLSGGNASATPLNPFEADVFEALKAKGIPLIPQWGASGYRIDFAAQHPKQPGRLVLAIECDGASYHSAPTARDRDRLRQQQLEALGWRFHRIWSTDWFLRRQQEIDRAVAAYQAAVAHVDEMDAQAQPAAPDPLPLPDDPADPPQPDKPNAAPSPAPANSPAPRRGRKPVVVRQSSIGKYEPAELVALVQWISSDGLLRTDEEIIDEMVKELGFKRRGTSIEEAIRKAIYAVPRK